MPATCRRGDPCLSGCADRRAHGDFEGKLCLAIEERQLPRPTPTCRSPCVAASPPRRATWAAPRSGSTDGCSRGFRRLHRRAMGSVDPTDGIAPDRIALVARGRARPRPHPRRFSTRLKRTPSRFRVCWRDRGRVRICRRADGFGFGLGPFLPIFCRQLLK